MGSQVPLRQPVTPPAGAPRGREGRRGGGRDRSASPGPARRGCRRGEAGALGEALEQLCTGESGSRWPSRPPLQMKSLGQADTAGG